MYVATASGCGPAARNPLGRKNLGKKPQPDARPSHGSLRSPFDDSATLAPLASRQASRPANRSVASLPRGCSIGTLDRWVQANDVMQRIMTYSNTGSGPVVITEMGVTTTSGAQFRSYTIGRVWWFLVELQSSLKFLYDEGPQRVFGLNLVSFSLKGF
jgi:hypothetical protein